MGKISLEGNFVFSSVGTLTPEMRKIKVLKQLGNELFICGDRVIPELVFTVPTDKVLTYAKIDNQGTGIDEWVVTLFLKPTGFITESDTNYNQQNAIAGDEEVVFVEKEGVTKNFSFEAPTKTIESNKVHTGNNHVHQILDITMLLNEREWYVTWKFNGGVDNGGYEGRTLDKNGRDMILGNQELNENLWALMMVDSQKSTAAEKSFYKEPHHKIKEFYDTKKYPDGSSFSLIEAQTFFIEETKRQYERERINAERETNGKAGNGDKNKVLDFVARCQEPGDHIVLLFAADPGWIAGGGYSWIRKFPTLCQGVPPPFPTFSATCTAIKAEKPVYCATFMGYYFTGISPSGYSFEGSPPFGGIVSGGSFGPVAKFVPDPKDLSSGQFKEVGDTITSVGGVGVVRATPLMGFNGLLQKWVPVQQLQNIFEQEAARGTVLLDARVFDGSKKGYQVKDFCERPIPPASGGGEEPDFLPPTSRILQEYFRHRFLIGKFTRSIKSDGEEEKGSFVIIRLTDENNEPINTEIKSVFGAEHGFSCNPRDRLFFSIDATQPILNQDLLTTKKNKTTWQVKRYIFTTFTPESGYYGSISGIGETSNSSWETEEMTEEVLPLKEFDKIWSYSYYSNLEKNA